MPRQTKYPAELRERAVRYVLEGGRPIPEVASDLAIPYEILRRWVRAAERQAELAESGVPADEQERLRALERENRELRRANEILKAASAFFATELDRSRPR